MKKPIIFSVFIFILTATPSFGQGVWSDVVRNLGFKSGKLDVNGKVYQINFGANLEGANLEGADLLNVDLRRSNLKEANLQVADLKYANFLGTNLSGAHLREAKLNNAVLSEANFTGANLVGANLNDAGAYEIILSGADLSGANLSGVILNYGILKDANFTGANLKGTDFIETDIRGANFTNADLEGTNFTQANITGAIFTGANVDKAIGLPNDLIFEAKNQKIAELESRLADKDIQIADLEKRPTAEELAAITAERDARPTIEQIQDARNGSIVINSENGTTTITFNIEESEDLNTWRATGEKITKSIQLKDGKKFYRFALDK